jgi:hypothetical protein
MDKEAERERVRKEEYSKENRQTDRQRREIPSHTYIFIQVIVFRFLEGDDALHQLHLKLQLVTRFDQAGLSAFVSREPQRVQPVLAPQHIDHIGTRAEVGVEQVPGDQHHQRTERREGFEDRLGIGPLGEGKEGRRERIKRTERKEQRMR